MSLTKKTIQGITFNLLKVLFAFCINIFIAKIFSDPVPFGLILYALSIIDFSAVIVSFGMNGALVRYSKEHFNEETFKEYIDSTLFFILYLQFIWLVVLLVWPDFWSEVLFQRSQTDLVQFVAFYTSLRVLRQLIFSTHWGMNDFFSRGITDFLPSFVNFIILLFTLIFSDKIENKIFVITSSFIVSEIISLIILNEHFNRNYSFRFLNLRRIFNSKLKFNTSFKKNLKFGFHTLLGALILTGMSLIDRFSINSTLTQATLGKYLTIYSLCSYLLIVVSVLSNVLLSNFIDKWKHESHSVVNKINNTFYLVNLIIFIFGLILFSIIEPLITFLYGTVYLGLEYLIPYLIIGILFQAFYMIYGNLSTLSEKPQITTYSLIPGIIIKFFGNFLLIKLLGIDAIVFVNIIAFCAVGITLILLLNSNKIRIGFKPFASTFFYCIIFLLLTH